MNGRLPCSNSHLIKDSQDPILEMAILPTKNAHVEFIQQSVEEQLASLERLLALHHQLSQQNEQLLERLKEHEQDTNTTPDLDETISECVKAIRQNETLQAHYERQTVVLYSMLQSVRTLEMFITNFF